jgi:hypothetical protein
VKSSSGASLVELIVALTVFTVGLLGLAGVASVVQRSFALAATLERGSDLVAEVLDSLLRVPQPVAGSRRADHEVAVSWTVEQDSVIRIRASVTGAAGTHFFTIVHSAAPR